MNKTYRSIWNAAKQVYVAAAETVTAKGKPCSGVKIAAVVAALFSGMGVHAQTAPAPNTLPTGGRLSAGQASISQSGANMVINQSTDRAAINWQTFNVGSNAAVQFQQPSAASVTLNRVMSSDPSQIFGRISANGQVILTNPSGVYFGKDSRVDVGGLVATTHSISDADFMAGKSRYERNGATGSVVNEGELKAALGGYIALLAPEVRNQGAIIAQMGTVALAAGEAIDLHFDSNSRLTSIRVEPSQLKALVDNRHAIEAPGGLIILAAQSMDRLIGGVVKNSGRIEANGLQQQGGRIVLTASHKVENTGSIAANATQDGPAGRIEISAPEVVNSGSITATGANSAGSALIQATNFAQTGTGSIDLSAPQQGGSLSLQATGKVQLQGRVDVSATVDGQGGSIAIAAGDIEVANATLNASGGQGGRIDLRAAAPAQPDNPNPQPDAPGDGRLAILSNSVLITRGRSRMGGSVALLGDHIELLDATTIDATGETGGGKVLVGGDWQGSNGVYQATTVTMGEGAIIDVSATKVGAGGTAVLWSDVHNADSVTTAQGSIFAKGGTEGGDGGQVETSGHSVDIDGFHVNTLAPQGKAGLWLIDPYNYNIGSGQASTIGTALNTSSVTVTTTASTPSYGGSTNSADVGSITVNSAITKTSGTVTTLTLQAHDRVGVNAAISGSSGSPLNVVLWANYGATRNVGVAIGAAITTYGGHLWAGGSSSGGSSTWNGLTVGNGASVGSTNGNYNGFDLNGNISTSGGDVLLWAGAGVSGRDGIGLYGNRSISTGSGNLTLLANQLYNWDNTNGTLTINTTGNLTLAPGHNGAWSNGFNWSGSTSGGAFTLTNIGGVGQPLAIQNVASLTGLTIGQYSGMSGVTLGNTSDVTISNAISVAGSIAMQGNVIYLNDNVTSTATGDMLFFGNALQAGNPGWSFKLALGKTITKSAGTGTLTIQGNGRINDGANTGNIQATGTAKLNVVMISEMDGGNSFGVSTGSISTNGGHVWIGGGAKTGTWNGFAVGSGPASATSGSGNSIDLTGNITTNGGEVMLRADGTNGIVLDADHAISAGSGNITLLTDQVARNGKYLTIGTAGAFTYAPENTAWLNIGTGLNVSGSISNNFWTGSGDTNWLKISNVSNLGGLVLGKEGNTSGIGMESPWSIAGPISLYGAEVILNANLTSTLSGAGILAKASGAITQAASVAVSTTGGSVTYWADSDNNGTGGVLLAAGTSDSNTSITTNGGAITLGGGTDPLTGYAKGANTTGATSFGVNLAGYGKLNAGTGAISLRGTTAETVGNYGIGVRLIDSSSLIGGDISLTGIGSANTGSNGNNWGVSVEASSTITASGTLAITGTGGGSNSTGADNFGVYITGSSIIGTGSGAVTITGTSGKNTAIGVDVHNGSTIRSGAGTLTLTALGTGAGGAGGQLSVAASSGTNTLGSSTAGQQSGNITLRGDTIYFTTTAPYTNQVLGTGTLTIEPVSTSFNVGWTGTSGITFGSSLSGLTFGKPGNTADITVYSGYGASIAGPISIYGGAVTLNAGLTTTNATTGDISIQTTGLRGSGNIALASGRGLTVTQSGDSIYQGIISGTGATLTKNGAGRLSLLNASTYTGGTTLSAGGLGLYSNTALGTGALTMAGGTSLLLGRAVTEIANDISLTGAASIGLDTNVDYLVLGGGGGGGNAYEWGAGGGGGAGGMLASTASFSGGSAVTVTVGAGGGGGAAVASSSSGANGGNSSIGTLLVASGGGGGGSSRAVGLSGGSGGGAGGRASSQRLGGAGTQGQGNAGGEVVGGYVSGGAGGGGAGGVGGSVSSDATGAGGAGLASAITGSSVTYATGGSGGNATSVQNGASAAANLGNGGGGASSNAGGASGAGGAGGSGIVVVRYKGATAGSGGTVSSGSGTATGYTLHTFTTTGSSTLTLNALNPVLKGVISGTGALTVNATDGTVTLAGGNTYSGGSTITAGTVKVGNGSTAGTLGTGAVTNNGALIFNRSDSFTLPQLISGSGSLTQQGPGTLILTADNSYAGTTTISAGTLQVGEGGSTGTLGSGAITDNGSLVFNRSDDVTVANAISGSGTLAKSGSNTLTLTANGSYTGATTISGGTLVLSNNAPTTGSSGFAGPGALRIEPTANDFTGAFSTSGWTFASTLTGLTLGKSGNTAAMTIASATTIAGPIRIYGGNIAINAALTATNENIYLTSSGAVTQSAALTANGLALLGSGTFTLTNTGNSIDTIAGGSDSARLGSLSFVNAGALTIGSVNPVGIWAVGDVKIETLSGNLTLSESIDTLSTSASAVVLNADRNANAGTSTGGNIIISGNPTIKVGAGGTAKLFSGSIADSAGVATSTAEATDGMVTYGSGRFRYGSDETTANYSAPLGSGMYVIYRERPTLTITADNQTIIYGDSPTLTTTATGTLFNGDTLANAMPSTPAATVSGSLNSTGYYDAGSYTLSLGAMPATSSLGYALTAANGSLTVGKKTLQVVAMDDAKFVGYNDTAMPSYQSDPGYAGVAYSGFVPGESVANITTTGLTVTRTNSGTETVNSYSAVLKPAGLATDKNYDFQYVYGRYDIVDINKLLVRVSDSTMTYAGQTPTLNLSTSSASYVSTSGGVAVSMHWDTENSRWTDDTNTATWNYGLSNPNVGVSTVTLNDFYTSTTLLTGAVVTGAVTITPKTLSLSATKEYDGSRAFASGSISTGVGNETLNYSNAQANSANVVDAAYFAAITLDNGSNGGLASNYELPSLASAATSVNTLSITPRALTVSATKTYDGTANVTASTTLGNLVMGESLTISNATISSAHVADNATNYIHALTLANGSGSLSNYALPGLTARSTDNTASIMARPIQVSLVNAGVSKVYDGSDSAKVGDGSSANAAFVPLFAVSNGVDGDALVIGNTGAAYNSANVLTATALTATGLSIASLSATTSASQSTDYSLLNTSASVGASITPRAVAVSGSNVSKVYDGTTAMNNVSIGFTAVDGQAESGVVAGQSLTVSGGTGAFSSANAGTGVAYSLSGFTLSSGAGTDVSNYSLPGGGSSVISGSDGVIYQRPLSIVFSGDTKVYDGSTRATATATFTNAAYAPVTGDDLSIVRTATYDTKNVGSGDSRVILSGVSLSGTAAGNYTLTFDNTNPLHSPTVGNNAGYNATASGEITRLDSVTWTGSGGNSNWFDPANWAATSNLALTGVVPDLANVATVIIPSSTTVNFNGTGSGLADASSPVSLIALQGNGAVLNVSTGTLNLGGDGGSLSGFVQTGGAVTSTGTFTVTESFSQTDGTLSSTGANAHISITQASGALSWKSMTSGGNLTVSSLSSIAFGTTSVGGNLLSSTGSGVTQTGPVTVTGSSTFVADTGTDQVALLDNAANNFIDAVSFTNANSGNWKNIIIVDGTGDLTLGDISATGKLDAESKGGSIKQDANSAITVDGTSGFKAKNDITLDGANDFKNTVNADAQNITLKDTNGITLGDITTHKDANGNGGDLSVDGGTGGITQDTSGTPAKNIVVDGETTLKADGDITLNGPTNDFQGPVNAEGKDITLKDSNGITLGDITTHNGGDLSVDGGTGNIAQDITKKIVVDGETTLKADGDITLNGPTNDFQGPVNAEGNDITLNDTNGLKLGNIDATGKLDATAGGDITQDNTIPNKIVVGGDTTLNSTGGDIKLDGANDFKGMVNAEGGDITLNDTNGLKLGNIDATGKLDATAGGDITQDNTGLNKIVVGGDTTLNSTTGDIKLDGANNDFQGPVNAEGQDIILKDTNGLKLGNIDATGKLDATAGGDITQDNTSAKKIVVDGETTLNSTAGDIKLDGANNDFQGPVNAEGNDITLKDTNGLKLGNIDASGKLDATAGGDITQDSSSPKKIVVDGETTLNSTTGDIKLDGANNDFQGPVNAEGNDITLKDTNELPIGNLNSRGNASLESNGNLDLGTSTIGGDLKANTHDGNVTQKGPLQVNGYTAIDAGKGSVNLTNPGNRLDQGATILGGSVNVAGDARKESGDLQGQIQGAQPVGALPGTSLSNAGAPPMLTLNAGMAGNAAPTLNSGETPPVTSGGNAGATGGSGIKIDLLPAPTTDWTMTAAVSVPPGTVTSGAGFIFELPDTIRAMIPEGASPSITLPDSSPAPSWLDFDARSLTFRANTVPAGALPLTVALFVGGQRVLVVISELSE